MSLQTCPSCGKQLTEYTRFCPECGARLPEAQAEPPASLPPAPPPDGLRTIVLPPDAAQPAGASPPTPPGGTPTPPGGTPTPAAPPTTPPGDTLPAPGAPTTPPGGTASAIPPTMRLDAPWSQPTAQPAPQTPPLPLGSVPPTSVPAGEPAAPKSRRTLWWILGGVGCLTVLLVGACVTIGALTLLGQRVDEGSVVAATPVLGGGGIVPDDSPLTGGAVLLEDDFSDTGVSSLDQSEDETSRSAYEDGVYVLEVKEAETVVWSLIGGPYEDVRLEVDAEVPAGAEVAAAGLVFHYQDNANFYLFSVSNDGYYALEVLQDGEWTTLIDPTLSDAVDSARNRLRVTTSGERIALYVNDTLLEETTDASFTSGEVGLAVSTFDTSPGILHFDNLVVARNE